MHSKTGKMQRNLVGLQSDAGSIIVSGKETRMSLDREHKYAQRHSNGQCVLAPNREGKKG